MKDTLKEGHGTSERITVDASRTIDFMGDDCRVYGTHWLVYDIEMTSRNFLLQFLDDGEDSVGTHIAIDHLAATPVDMWVEVKVDITEVKGRMVTLEVACRDQAESIARGTHRRFIVDVATTADRIRKKKAGAS